MAPPVTAESSIRNIQSAPSQEYIVSVLGQPLGSADHEPDWPLAARAYSAGWSGGKCVPAAHLQRSNRSADRSGTKTQAAKTQQARGWIPA